MGKVEKNEMNGSSKASAMLDLWTSVKRVRGKAPRDRPDDREEEPRRNGSRSAVVPVIAPVE